MGTPVELGFSVWLCPGWRSGDGDFMTLHELAMSLVQVDWVWAMPAVSEASLQLVVSRIAAARWCSVQPSRVGLGPTEWPNKLHVRTVLWRSSQLDRKSVV